MVATTYGRDPNEFKLYQFLDTIGDGTGTVNAIGDYSSAAADFFIQPPVGQRYVIHRMLINITASGVVDSGFYGDGLVLTNGIQVLTARSDDTVTCILSGQLPILTNSDWGQRCFDAPRRAWGAGNEYIPIRWTFSKGGRPIVLENQAKLIVRLNDDFTGAGPGTPLVLHTFFADGTRDFVA